MFVGTAQSVPCRARRRNGKALFRLQFQFPLAKRGVSRSLFARMDAELEKLVEAGKLTARQADQLQELKPGTFCLHESWGFGRVAEWNLLLNQVMIDFPGKKAHPMQ